MACRMAGSSYPWIDRGIEFPIVLGPIGILFAARGGGAPFARRSVLSSTLNTPSKRNSPMPFANFKLPEAALTAKQKEEIVHRTTAMLVEYFSEAARPHTMVLIEEVKDGGYARADEVFVIPEEYRVKE